MTVDRFAPIRALVLRPRVSLEMHRYSDLDLVIVAEHFRGSRGSTGRWR